MRYHIKFFVIFISFLNLFSSEECITNLEENRIETRANNYEQGDPFGQFLPVLLPIQINTDDPFIVLGSDIPLLDDQTCFTTAVAGPGAPRMVLVVSYVVQMGTLRDMVLTYQAIKNNFSPSIPVYRAYTASFLTLSGLAPLKAILVPTMKVFVDGAVPTNANFIEFAGFYTVEDLTSLVRQAYKALVV